MVVRSGVLCECGVELCYAVPFLCKADMNQSVGEGKERKSAFLNNGHKAYLPTGNLKQGASYGKSLGLYFSGTTNLNEVKGENGKVKTIYDLQGIKVGTPAKGIYIIDGRKVLVK